MSEKIKKTADKESRKSGRQEREGNDMTTKEILEQAREAKTVINAADEQTKNLALQLMASHLEAETEKILAANREDMEQAKGKISDVMLDRLF